MKFLKSNIQEIFDSFEKDSNIVNEVMLVGDKGIDKVFDILQEKFEESQKLTYNPLEATTCIKIVGSFYFTEVNFWSLLQIIYAFVILTIIKNKLCMLYLEQTIDELGELALYLEKNPTNSKKLNLPADILAKVTLYNSMRDNLSLQLILIEEIFLLNPEQECIISKEI